MSHDFFLVAPYLDNYDDRLFVVSHPLGLYPLDIQVDLLDRTIRCELPDDFQGNLREIFSSEKTKRVIQSLIAQTEAVGVKG